MSDEDMKKMAEMVREMRDSTKARMEHCGITAGTSQWMFENGRIMGYTDVLTLIDPNPYN